MKIWTQLGSSKLRKNSVKDKNKNLSHKFRCLSSRPQLRSRIQFKYFSEKLLLRQKLRYFRESHVLYVCIKGFSWFFYYYLSDKLPFSFIRGSTSQRSFHKPSYKSTLSLNIITSCNIRRHYVAHSRHATAVSSYIISHCGIFFSRFARHFFYCMRTRLDSVPTVLSFALMAYSVGKLFFSFSWVTGISLFMFTWEYLSLFGVYFRELFHGSPALLELSRTWLTIRK